MLSVPLPPALVLRNGAIEAPPALVAELIERLIVALDEHGGDPDLEDARDEGEPNFSQAPPGEGPGCAISDPDSGVDDEGEDVERMIPAYGIDQRRAIGLDHGANSLVGAGQNRKLRQ